MQRLFHRSDFPARTVLLVVAALVTSVQIAGIAVVADSAAEFSSLLDQLEQSKTAEERGFDQMWHGTDSPGKRVVQMLGSCQTWDPYGTPALRKAVLSRWRKRFAKEGGDMLHGLVPAEAMPGRVAVQAGEVRFARDIGQMHNQFFLSNSRLYELGAMDGSFPPSGFMLGDQSGVWVGPLKALDGFGFVLRQSGKPARRLDRCQDFSHDFASCTFRYEFGDYEVTRTDFPATETPALFSRLTLRNQLAEERIIEVDFVANINVRPDWRTAGQNKQQNDLDVIESQSGFVRAFDPHFPQSMVVLGAHDAVPEVRIEDARATLSYRVKIPPTTTVELNCLIRAGIANDNRKWAEEFRELAARSEAELKNRKEKVSAGQKNGVQFTCSDRRLREAFLLGKANLQLLTADCRPHFPDVYLMAGVPVYPRLFACDSCLSLPGVTAVGFWPEARGTLRCLAAQARKYESLVPHESATDGSLIGPSNSQETTQFIAACAQYLRWSADTRLAAELYPLLIDAWRAHRKKFVSGDYPAGNALIETRGMGARKIDAASWQYAALASLAEVAQALGKKEEAENWHREAGRLSARIRRDWWMPGEKMWADSLDAKDLPKHQGLWSVAFPLLAEIGTAEQTSLTLDGLQSGWINQWGGVHTREADISRQGSGVVTTGVIAEAAFAYRRDDLGLRLLKMNSEASRQDRMPGAFTEMIPPGGSDFAQLWSVGPFLAAVVEGLGGIHPRAFDHELELCPQLPEGLEWMTLDNIEIGDHKVSLDVRRENRRIVVSLAHRSGSAPLKVVFVPVNQSAEVVVNGKSEIPAIQRLERLDRNVRVITHAVAAGSTISFTD